LDNSFEDLQEEIGKIFSKATAADEAEDNKIDSEFITSSPTSFWDAIWPVVMRCETFFRNSNDIRALELQVGALMEMESSVYRGAYLADAYTVCRRILEIDPDNPGAKDAVERGIIPHWKNRFTRNPDAWKNLKKGDNPLDKIPIITRQEIESMLEKQFKEKKDNNYDYFLDDWQATHKLEVESSNDSGDWDGFEYSSKGTRY
jgi:hypothetical protein